VIAAYVDHWAPLLGRLTTERKAAEAAAYEALEDAELAAEPRPFEPGDQVRYTVGMTLAVYGRRDAGRNLGRKAAPFDRQFTVQACDCGLCQGGRFVALSGSRHILKANVEHVPLALQRPVASCG
jgi:hypothetical protein